MFVSCKLLCNDGIGWICNFQQRRPKILCSKASLLGHEPAFKKCETTSAIQGTHLCPKSAMLNRPFETSRWRHCPYRSYSAVQTAHCMFGVQNPLTCNKVFVSTLVYHGKTPLLSRVKLWRIPRLQRKLRFQSTDDFIPTQAPIPVHVTHTEPGFEVLGQRTSGNMWKQQTASVKVEGLKAPFSSNSGAQV